MFNFPRQEPVRVGFERFEAGIVAEVNFPALKYRAGITVRVHDLTPASGVTTGRQFIGSIFFHHE